MRAGDTRREFLRKGGLGLLLFQIDGVARWLTPREARAENLPLEVLTMPEMRTLEAFGETLLPGATEAGIAHFVDKHLSVPAADSLLMIRYLDVPPPYAAFYRAGLASLDRFAEAQQGAPFAALSAEARTALVRAMSGASPEGWEGPPAPLFYFTVRADAVDVVYGTMEGFEKLGVPYMAHIEPPTRW